MYNFHISLKSLTKENARIKGTNDLLLERNALLENELLSLEKCKKECQIDKDELILSLNREEVVQKFLAREQGVICKWTNFANVSQHIREIQGNINFLDPGHVDIQSVHSESTDVSSMDMNHPSTSKVSTDENYPSIKDKLKQENKLAKLKRKYCHLNNFVKKLVSEDETKTNTEKVNVGYLCNKQLKDKIENIETRSISVFDSCTLDMDM